MSIYNYINSNQQQMNIITVLEKTEKWKQHRKDQPLIQNDWHVIFHSSVILYQKNKQAFK